jgi:sulfonate transport system substrate-binding protein
MTIVCSRRGAALGAAAVLVASLLTGCGSTTAAAKADGPVDLSEVTIKVGDQAGQTKARFEAAKALAGAKYKVEWSEFAAAAPLLEALRAKAIDIGGAGDAPILNAIGGGAKIKVVSASRSVTNQGLALLVPKDSPIHSVADLKGKAVSPTTKGSVGHFLTLGLLKKNGLTASDVNLTYLQPADAQAAFNSGKIDAWGTWDPYTAIVQNKGGRVLADGTGISKGLGFYAGSTEALADRAKRAAIADFIKRIGASLDWANANRNDNVKLVAQLTKLPEDVVRIQTTRGATNLVPLDDTVVADLQDVADTYYDAKVLPTKLNVGTYFDKGLY